MGRYAANRAPALAATACACIAGLFCAAPAAAHHGEEAVAELPPRQLEQVLGAPAEPNADDLYEIEVRGPDLLTHGPDLQLAASGASQIGFRNGDPERAPVCSDGYRQHVLYARTAGSTDRYPESVGPIRAAMRRANAVLNRDSLESGGPTADYKIACEEGGEIAVDSFEAPAADYSSVVAAARAAGFNDPDTDYTIFFDGSNGGSCGIGSYYSDERPGAENYNNRGGGFGVTYRGCWFNETPMHENAHNQGAVQYSAPQSTGSGGHCWEEIDVMCYAPDGGDKHQQGTVLNCSDRAYFDCGFDTYFDSAPEAGEYLESHWNMGSPVNRFIAFDAGTELIEPPVETPEPVVPDPLPDPEPEPTPPTTPEPPDPGETTDPVVTEPEPAPRSRRVPRLPNGKLRSDASNRTGGWREYRIRVPRRSRSLKVKLSSRVCGGRCDLDLYVRRAKRPTLQAFDCAPSKRGSRENCRVRAPRKGRWFVGVYSSSAPEAAGFTVRAKHAPERKRR